MFNCMLEYNNIFNCKLKLNKIFIKIFNNKTINKIFIKISEKLSTIVTLI